MVENDTYNKKYNTYKINEKVIIRHQMNDVEGNRAYWNNFNKRWHTCCSNGIEWNEDWQDYSEYVADHYEE